MQNRDEEATTSFENSEIVANCKDHLLHFFFIYVQRKGNIFFSLLRRYDMRWRGNKKYINHETEVIVGSWLRMQRRQGLQAELCDLYKTNKLKEKREVSPRGHRKFHMFLIIATSNLKISIYLNYHHISLKKQSFFFAIRLMWW